MKFLAVHCQWRVITPLIGKGLVKKQVCLLIPSHIGKGVREGRGKEGGRGREEKGRGWKGGGHLAVPVLKRLFSV